MDSYKESRYKWIQGKKTKQKPAELDLPTEEKLQTGSQNISQEIKKKKHKKNKNKILVFWGVYLLFQENPGTYPSSPSGENIILLFPLFYPSPTFLKTHKNENYTKKNRIITIHQPLTFHNFHFNPSNFLRLLCQILILHKRPMKTIRNS